MRDTFTPDNLAANGINLSAQCAAIQKQAHNSKDQDDDKEAKWEIDSSKILISQKSHPAWKASDRGRAGNKQGEAAENLPRTECGYKQMRKLQLCKQQAVKAAAEKTCQQRDQDEQNRVFYPMLHRNTHRA